MIDVRISHKLYKSFGRFTTTNRFLHSSFWKAGTIPNRKTDFKPPGWRVCSIITSRNLYQGCALSLGNNQSSVRKQGKSLRALCGKHTLWRVAVRLQTCTDGLMTRFRRVGAMLGEGGEYLQLRSGIASVQQFDRVLCKGKLYLKMTCFMCNIII